MVSTNLKVHYFYDPMCGWCYGATSIIEALAEMDNIEIIYHPGGMINRQAITEEFKQHILKSDQSIAEITGAEFGEAYFNRLQGSEDLVFDSYITIRAIVVAEEMGTDPLTMIKAIQKAHFQQGKQVELLENLADIAEANGLDKTIWTKKMQQGESAGDAAIQKSKELMGQHQVQGFPTLIAETSNGYQRLAHTSYYQDIAGWKKLLRSLT